MGRLHSSVAIVVVLLLLGAAPVGAQWTTLGTMAPERRADTLVFRDAKTILSVAAVTPEIIRVRFSPTRDFGRDHSYAVVLRPAELHPVVQTATARSTLTTSAVRVVVSHAPLRVSFADAAGHSMDEDNPANGIAYSGRAVRVWKRLQDDEHIYGFGEKNGRLDKRGRNLGGYSYAMWNSDTYAYEADTDPIYVTVPFFIVLRNGIAHGIFFDNTFRSSFDIGHQSQGLLSFGAEGGELNYYFIYGPTPKDVIAHYTELTGRMPLPPRWALGYHQCRYSYFPDSKVRFIADNFRERQIPADVVWLDIHYLEDYVPFTWDKDRFPDPPGLTAYLRGRGFRTVTIIDPHPKKQVGYGPYDSGLAGNHFVKNPDGSIFEAPVWPSKAEHNPGPSVFPDFSRVATRAWWGRLYESLVNVGVAGIWNDMNEPAVFNGPTWTMPLDVRHDNEGAPTDHREIHNVYGLLMSRSTHEGLLALRPNERPFVLTRASYAGGQRYAALWPGDNVSDWTQLRSTIPLLTGMGLSGLPFVGSDIGGFAEAPSAELYTRWLQCGVFYPFMRTHTTFGTPDQEPWSYGTMHEQLNRRAIELRYELLPHIYNVMHEASATGIPAMRPLVLEFPTDENTYGLDDQFMFGSDLLVAPVLREGVRERGIYLPAGTWYDYWTAKTYTGPTTITIPVTLASIPIFVRAGAFVFQQPVVQHTGEMAGKPLRVSVYPAAHQSSTSLYEDDGETLDYSRGVFLRRRLDVRQAPSDRALTTTIALRAPEGTYRPAARDLVVIVRTEGEVERVVANGATLARRSQGDFDAARDGWTVNENGSVVVKQPDRFEAVAIEVTGQR
jgi:alpha-glucosidase